MRENEFTVTVTGSLLEGVSDTDRLHAREDFLRSSVYDWPGFEFPGYKKAPKPKVTGIENLVNYLYSRIAEALHPPLHFSEDFTNDNDRYLAATLADIADDLIYSLECLARNGNVIAAQGLHEITETSCLSVNRELDRGNDWLEKKIRNSVRWPHFGFSNPSLRNRVAERLKERGFGEGVPEPIRKAGIADPAHQLVNSLFHYMDDTRKKIGVIEKEKPLADFDQKRLSPVLLILRNLPLQLTEENHLQWHDAAIKIMEITAGHENFWSHHPAFKNEPLKPLVPVTGDGANMIRTLKAAWLKRASSL